MTHYQDIPYDSNDIAFLSIQKNCYVKPGQFMVLWDVIDQAQELNLLKLCVNTNGQPSYDMTAYKEFIREKRKEISSMGFDAGMVFDKQTYHYVILDDQEELNLFKLMFSQYIKEIRQD